MTNSMASSLVTLSLNLPSLESHPSSSSQLGLRRGCKPQTLMMLIWLTLHLQPTEKPLPITNRDIEIFLKRYVGTYPRWISMMLHQQTWVSIWLASLLLIMTCHRSFCKHEIIHATTRLFLILKLKSRRNCCQENLNFSWTTSVSQFADRSKLLPLHAKVKKLVGLPCSSNCQMGKSSLARTLNSLVLQLQPWSLSKKIS